MSGKGKMPRAKLKTNRSAAKRLKITGTGKVKRSKGWKRHLLSGKNSSRKRRLGRPALIDKDNMTNIKRMLPYGSK